MALPDPRILVHTARYVVVDKPSGMLSVPGKGEANQDCVAARLRAKFLSATGPLIVHRLDMDTSGLMVVALDADAHRELSRQFEQREVRKHYIAIVSGHPSLYGVIDAPMRLDVDRRPIQIIDPIQGRPARTEYRVLETSDDASRIELTPITGRTHQLRLHMAHIGHPILGDPFYGTRDSAPRLMLHASYLAFTDPDGGTPRAYESPPPF